jgi:hypothetical protein
MASLSYLTGTQPLLLQQHLCQCCEHCAEAFAVSPLLLLLAVLLPCCCWGVSCRLHLYTLLLLLGCCRAGVRQGVCTEGLRTEGQAVTLLVCLLQHPVALPCLRSKACISAVAEGRLGSCVRVVAMRQCGCADSQQRAPSRCRVQGKGRLQRPHANRGPARLCALIMCWLSASSGYLSLQQFQQCRGVLYICK